MNGQRKQAGRNMPSRRCNAREYSENFQEEERRSMSATWFAAEYMCEFTEAVDSVFSYEHVMAAVAEDVEPLDFGGEE
jgi:hypothetical protein